MGWWENDDGDMLGDGPADLFVEVLRKSVPRLTWQGLLDGIAQALVEVGHQVVQDPERLRSFELRARFESPVADFVGGGSPDDDVVARVTTFLVESRDAYESTLRRRPTLRELLRTIRFCLCGSTLSYLTDGVDRKLLDLVPPIGKPDGERALEEREAERNLRARAIEFAQQNIRTNVVVYGKQPFQHFLDSLASVLRFESVEVIADPEIALPNVRAVFEDARTARSGGAALEDHGFENVLTDLLVEIHHEYVSSLGRSPTLEDSLSLLAAVMRYPEDYCSDGNGQRLASLVTCE